MISDRRPLMVSCSVVDSVDCADTALIETSTHVADLPPSLPRTAGRDISPRSLGERMSRRCRHDTSAGFSRGTMMGLKRPQGAGQRATEPVLVTSAAIAAAVRFPRGVRTLI